MKSTLRFRDDGTFKIVQFTDVHWRNGNERDLSTRKVLDLVLKEDKPDLIVFTGDLIDSTHCEDVKRSFREVLDFAEHAATPFAFVFGNHDSEAGATREELMEIAQEYAYNLAEAGPSDIDGVGNYLLSILDHKEEAPVHTLYFLDSGSYAPAEPIGGYEWIHHSQIQWYAEEAKKRAELRQESIPALAFFHIPLPEYTEVWEKGACIGNKLENVCSPRINSGLFTQLLESGDVVGTFVGHDHLNDYEGDLYGIRLCYGRATGYSTYGREDFERGARIIQLREGEKSFTTWIRLANGQVIEEKLPVNS
ncbi:metallophosphoesterase family protein [Paenibacillus sp. 1001270B_150601_E10]|uniref:metallophosphoesterase family protein n=1 Tax=Paenibacillus sp. 1001270B_150601_E10 TaxID=2787079 RepID=UPI00189E2F6B|nr:metallophosphoesterase family protein [Paenibacillus sp. 1001270B_150601_E10]